MNKNGNPGTLVPSHPGNTNAMKHGVYSERRIQSRAAQIVAELIGSFEFSVAQRLAVGEVARSTAILEAIDRELDEAGLVNKRGDAHSLLNYRTRISRQLHRWLSDLAPSIERQSAGALEDAGRLEFVRELKWIASGKDATASAHDRVAAIKELLRAEAPSTTEPQVSVIRIIREDDGTERMDYMGEEPYDARIDTEA
jgi:hypothetical protein